MSKTGRRIALLCLMVAFAAPAAADPISYTFSTTVTQAFGPIQDVFGRTFVRGDLLTGRVIVDPDTFSPDMDARSSNAIHRRLGARRLRCPLGIQHGRRVDARSSNAQYTVGSGRVVFDVPSAFSMDAAMVDTFFAFVENSAANVSSDYARVDLMDRLSAGAFNALLVTFVDPTGRALSSTAWPATLQGLSVTELRFNGYRGNSSSIVLYGDSPAPVPEPGTMSLMAGGLAAAYWRARRRRSS